MLLLSLLIVAQLMLPPPTVDRLPPTPTPDVEPTEPLCIRTSRGFVAICCYDWRCSNFGDTWECRWNFLQCVR